MLFDMFLTHFDIKSGHLAEGAALRGQGRGPGPQPDPAQGYDHLRN